MRYLTNQEFDILQDRVDSINPPPGIGRIPRKISSAFSSFTADEWKHWTLIYSVYALYNIVPEEHYQCWCSFVEACQILCQIAIGAEEVEKAHLSIIRYCVRFQEFCGRENCTPNMHMACYLRTCILDYGPLAAFWAFSFERYNGILEGLQKSWRGPERQMLKKFIGLQAIGTGESLMLESDNTLIASMRGANNYWNNIHVEVSLPLIKLL